MLPSSHNFARPDTPLMRVLGACWSVPVRGLIGRRCHAGADVVVERVLVRCGLLCDGLQRCWFITRSLRGYQAQLIEVEAVEV